MKFIPIGLGGSKGLLGTNEKSYLAFGIGFGIPFLVVTNLVVIWHRRRSSH